VIAASRRLAGRNPGRRDHYEQQIAEGEQEVIQLESQQGAIESAIESNERANDEAV
jgi:hypothetical protein